MLIQNRVFSGERRKTAVRNIDVNEASIALDCEIVSGELRPIKTNLSTGINVGDAKTIFYVDGQWLSWDKKVDVIRSPSTDPETRIFWTGDGKPKQATLAEFNAGISYSAGVPKPSEDPHLSFTTVDPEVNPKNIFVVYTFVNAYGEEGDKSEPSAIGVVSEGATISLNNIGLQGANISLVTEHNIVSQRIYVYDSDADAVRFLVEIPITETFHTWTQGDQLNEIFSTEDFNAPPVDLQGLHLMANGVAIGFSGRTVYVTEPYQPNAWKHFFVVDQEIVAVSSFDTSAVIMTEGFNYIATIFDPANISTAVVADREPCVTPHSVVQGLGGVLFASPGGIYFISPAGGRMITEDFFDKADWEEVKPDSLNAVFVDGQYIGFHDSVEKDGRAIVFDTRESNAISRQLSQHTEAFFVLPGTDELYLVSDGIIELFQGGEDFINYLWRSKPHGSGSHFALAARRLISLDFYENPTVEDIVNADLLINQQQADNATLLLELGGTSPYVGYGGALNQDTIGGLETYSIGGVTDPLQSNSTIGGGHESSISEPAYTKSCTLRVYGSYYVTGGLRLLHEESIFRVSDERLTYADRYRFWTYELEGQAAISQIDMAGSMSEMHSGS